MRQLTKKIRPLDELKYIGGILCHGCFDVLHIGHIRHLMFARALSGSMPLTVTLTADRYIRKGPGRPVFDHDTRAEVIAALEMVDYVAIADEATGLTSIQLIKPNYYVKGEEYAAQIGINEIEQRTVRQQGGQTIFTPRFYSSTEILNRVSCEP